jgi:hypothetical protein
MTTDTDLLQEVKISARKLPDDKPLDTRDFRIGSISLISSAGISVDISNMVAEIQIHQDIYLGFMSGMLVMVDGVDLHSTMVLHGGEFLYVSIKEPTTRDKIKISKTFRVYKISDRVPINNSSQRYMLYFISDEYVLASSKIVSKAYKNTRISDIAKDIMSSYMKISSDKMKKIDETTAPVDLVIIPNLHPHEAIFWLLTRAFSTEKSSCWFFFENLEGFNFRSLNSLYNDPFPVKVPFTFENKIIAKTIDMDKYAIDSFTVKQDFDVLQQLAGGGYAMSLLGLDLQQQTFEKTEFSLTDSSYVKMYDVPSMSNAEIEEKRPLLNCGECRFMTYHSSAKDWIRRVMVLSTLNNTLIEIAIPGNLRIQVGSLISIRFPLSITPKEKANMWDKHKSGRYLVVGVNHKFDMLAQRFESILMIVRDSLPTAIESVDVSLPSKIRKMNNSI